MLGSSANPRTVAQFDADMVHTNNLSVIQTIPFGTTANVDLKLTDDHCLTGGILRTSGSAFGDYATFQVVDVDNILGHGAGTVLGQYCTKWYMRSDAEEQVNETASYPVKILGGLYLRVIYVSVSLSVNVQVAIIYRLHKLQY